MQQSLELEDLRSLGKVSTPVSSLVVEAYLVGWGRVPDLIMYQVSLRSWLTYKFLRFYFFLFLPRREEGGHPPPG
jgi:hypothetical protein